MTDFSFKIDKRMTPRNDFVVNYCGKVKGQKILDIGCSYGWLEERLLKKGAKEIVGIEPQKEFFHDAPKLISGAKFVVGSAIEIPFKDNSFDITIMLETLEHLPKNTEKIAFMEIFRVLCPGGKLFMSTPNFHPISCFLDPAWYFGHRHYDSKKIEKMLKQVGFQVDDVFLYGGFWEMFRMLPHYLFKWVFKKEDPFKKYFDKKIKDDGVKTTGYAYIYLKATKK